jgi:hypothetical protein
MGGVPKSAIFKGFSGTESGFPRSRPRQTCDFWAISVLGAAPGDEVEITKMAIRQDD